MARQRARRQRRRGRDRAAPAASACCIRSRPTRCSCAAPPPSATALRAQGFGFYDWGADAARFVTAWDTREEDARALAARDRRRCERAPSQPPHALLRPRIALPFLLVALIWGSTWYVITGQIAEVPPSWSVTYRFALATPAMFALALVDAAVAAACRGAAHVLALAIGLTQFCGNFNFVYRAELHLTSGIVAVMFGC